MKATVLAAAFVVAAAVVASADPLSFASVLSDHAVLQRDVDCPVWGWAESGAKVTVRSSLGGEAETVAGEDGYWLVKLPAHQACANPFTITAKSGGERIRVPDPPEADSPGRRLRFRGGVPAAGEGDRPG